MLIADLVESLRNVECKNHTKTPHIIIGRNTKKWYGGLQQGSVLSLAEHTGIVSYESTELVVTVRAGTTLQELNAVLLASGQCLPFEPPNFGKSASLGGTIACNFSGPARPYVGSARDYVLGCTLLNGKGEMLKFGGQVMKNVAGYDVARLMAGSMGTLGVILDISLKVLPLPESEITLVQALDQATALTTLQQYGLKPYPITGAYWYDGQLYVRLAGATGAVKQARSHIVGDVVEQGKVLWQQLRDHQSEFFQRQGNLWRLSVPADTPPLALAGDCLVDWGGAQRWLWSEQTPEAIRAFIEPYGGYATLFRTNDESLRASGNVFHPLSPSLLRYHQQLKQAFDPHGIFNRQRMYLEF